MPRPERRRLERRRVVQVARYLPQYRREFFELARQRLCKEGVDFELVHGQPGPVDGQKGDASSLQWASEVRNRYLLVRGRELCWQPCLSQVADADLVIIEQGTRLLVNYLLFAYRPFARFSLAFWGHGLHFQPHRSLAYSERIKSFYTRRADWWFAYTGQSVDTVASLGFPRSRITLLQNAIDTRSLFSMRASLTDEELSSLRHSLGLGTGPVGVFAGSLYAEKRVPFLIQACDEIRRRIPDFGLLVIGDGADRAGLDRLSASRPWVRVLGARFGRDKARHLALGDVFLMPGLVGLAILDAFAVELPLVTTRVPYHSHEIAYLDPDVNGVMVEDWRSSTAYAQAVADLLGDAAGLQRMRNACRVSREKYTVEAMAENFSEGVLRALAESCG